MVNFARTELARILDHVLLEVTSQAVPPSTAHWQRRDRRPRDTGRRGAGYRVPSLQYLLPVDRQLSMRPSPRQRGQVVSCWAGPVDPGFSRAAGSQSPPQSHASLRVQTRNISRYLRVSTATSRRTCRSRRVSRKRPTSASSTPGSIGQGLGKDACSQQSRGFCRWKLRAWGEMIEETMSGGRNGCTSQGFETDCDSPFPSHLQQNSKMRGTGRCRSNTTAPT